MKKTWVFAVLTALVVIVAACGKEEAKPSDVDGDATAAPAALTLETKVSYDETAKQLSATVSMTNPNDTPVDVTFNSSQRFQLTVSNGETTLFDYGQDYMFTDAIVEETWEAGATKVFDEVFPLELENGDYTVNVTALGQVDGAPEIAVTDEQTFTVNVEAPTEPSEPTDDSSEEPAEEPAEEPSGETTTGTPQSDGPFTDVTIDRTGATLNVSGFTDEVEFEWSVSDGHDVFAQGAAEVTSGGFMFGVLLDEEPAANQPLFLELTPIGGDVTSFKIQ